MKISEFMKKDYREFAMYTVQLRGIPSLIDGFKPVQRFLLYQGMHTAARSEFMKTASLGSSVSSAGYEHGEGSAVDALVGMTAEYNNNIPLFEGDGNFGNKIDHTASAARYIFSKLSPIVDKIYMDTELAPEHEDKDHLPPKFYLPIIPMVLVNGIKGIAVGFATDIPSYDPRDIVDNLRLLASGKGMKDMVPRYPMYEGSVWVDELGIVYRQGVVEKVGKKKVLVSELLPGMEVDAYKKVLNKLVDKRVITSYVDDSADNRIRIEVNLVDGDVGEDEVYDVLKLRDKSIPNFTVINERDELREYRKDTGALDIVRDFYEYRIGKVEEGRLRSIEVLRSQLGYSRSFLRLCEDVVGGIFDFRKIESDDRLVSVLKSVYGFVEDDAKKVMNIPLRSFTKSSIEMTKKRIKSLESDIDKLEHQTKEELYIEKLDILAKALENS